MILALKRAINAERGNVQAFLERLLVEVASENYRYFLSEHLSYRGFIDQEANVHCWPPLLSNERQVTGLFAVGLSRGFAQYQYPSIQFNVRRWPVTKRTLTLKQKVDALII